MAGKRLSPGRLHELERVKAKRARANADARRFLKTALPGVNPDDLTVSGVLRAMRKTMSVALSAATRAALRTKLVDALTAEFTTLKIKPADLGQKSVEELAELFLRMLERADVTGYTATRLRSQAAGAFSRKPGLRSTFAGELFELLVRNLEELQKDLRGLAQAELDDLKPAVAGKAGKRPALLDGNGKRVQLDGTFGPVQQVTDVVTDTGSGKLKFIDTAYVSVFTPSDGGAARLVFLVEVEIKLPGAAKGFSKQIGSALARFSTADGVEVVFAGAKTPTPFKRAQLIVDPRAMYRTAVTTTQRTTPTYRWRTTRKGGYREAYLRIGLTIDVDALYRLVNLLFRA
jgi:hypothetical protein